MVKDFRTFDIKEVESKPSVDYRTYRVTVKDCANVVTDIYEGPFRVMMNVLLTRIQPDTKLGIRKVKK